MKKLLTLFALVLFSTANAQPKDTALLKERYEAIKEYEYRISMDINSYQFVIYELQNGTSKGNKLNNAFMLKCYQKHLYALQKNSKYLYREKKKLIKELKRNGVKIENNNY